MAIGRRKTEKPLKYRGMLIHMTHYDPVWNKLKATERRYDKATAEAVIRAMAKAGMNLLLIDVKDAVLYRSLPQLRKRYSVPMSELAELARLARSLGLEVVPKLNFSRSPTHRHSHWLDETQADPDSPKFWEQGFAAIDEVLRATGATRLHVGMDEDDTRSPEEYHTALVRLYRGLKRRGVKMAMWADVGHRWRPQQRWKEVPAIRKMPRDVMLVPWSYHVAQDEWTRKLKRWGFEVLGGCSCGTAKDNPNDPLKNAREWVKAVRAARADGLVLTKWIKCSRKNRAELLEAVRAVGPVMSG